MNTFIRYLLMMGVVVSIGCSGASKESEAVPAEAEGQAAGQATVQDDESQKDILKIAIGSPDHTTLVAAVKAAALENTLSNAGPFTVFAPTNAAFNKLPAGTVESLVKPENVDKLTTILYHHVLTSALDQSSFTDGQVVTMFDGSPVTMSIKDNVWKINDAKIIGSVRASNGWVHIVDGVVVPK